MLARPVPAKIVNRIGSDQSAKAQAAGPPRPSTVQNVPKDSKAALTMNLIAFSGTFASGRRSAAPSRQTATRPPSAAPATGPDSPLESVQNHH